MRAVAVSFAEGVPSCSLLRRQGHQLDEWWVPGTTLFPLVDSTGALPPLAFERGYRGGNVHVHWTGVVV